MAAQLPVVGEVTMESSSQTQCYQQRGKYQAKFELLRLKCSTALWIADNSTCKLHIDSGNHVMICILLTAEFSWLLSK